MKKLFLVINSYRLGILISVAFFYWGFLNDGYIRMIIGGFILFTIVRSIITDFKYALELDTWMKTHQNRLILFYPAKKPIQELIKTEFIPKIPFPVMEVYYDGPKLVGDIKQSVTKELMVWNKDAAIHKPCILKIKNKEIISEKLTELTLIGKQEINYQELIVKIEKIKNA
ncbi:hypothetical protein ACFO3O_14345 [Dokdonia ponticola]|uniref:Uncharacterized protein n=1 Tax=Dokdonia ponticola TaxID=2041041 RepID=A0ABV9HZ25_9FLAO